MGTNFYLMTRNKELAHKNFAIEAEWGIDCNEYQLVESPYLGYEVHLNKLSWGWRPLFQKHKAFCSWAELEKFYKDHKEDLEIYDEYERKLTLEEYKERVFDHVSVEPRPYKWVYGKEFTWDTQDHIHLEECEPEEAEIWTPFDHLEYFKTEKAAGIKYGERTYSLGVDYQHDPDHPFDWTEGEFC